MHIEKMDEDGDLLVRDSLLAAFFSKRPYPTLAKAFGGVFEDWLSQTPDDAKKWAIIGPDADEYKAFTSKHIARAKAEFDSARAKTRDLSALELGGPQKINPDRKFTFIGARDLDDDETNVLQIQSPSGEGEGANVEAYVEKVCRIAEQIPFDSGYATPALVYGADAQKMDFAEAARKWAFRHPGFDMPNNGSTNSALGQKLRGAYWLTFVGPWALKKLGGGLGLRKSLPKEIEVQTVGDGVMLRVGKHPEVGDVNRGQKLPMLRTLAKVLEPVTLFDDSFLNSIFVDDAQRARWERRHLD